MVLEFLPLYFNRDVDGMGLNGNCKIHGMPPPPPPPAHLTPSRASHHPLLRSTELSDADIDCEVEGDVDGRRRCWINCPEVTKAVEGVRFIAEHTRREEESIRVSEYTRFGSVMRLW